MRQMKAMNKVLNEQCEEYAIRLEYIQIPWDKATKKYAVDNRTLIKRAEEAVLYRMCKEGFQGTAWELHPVMMLLQAGCAEYLEKCAQSIRFEDFRARTFNVQIGMYGLEQQKALNAIKAKSREELLKGWAYIYANEQNEQWFPGLEPESVAAVLDGLGLARLYQIAEILFENSDDNANGWPDIFAYDGKQILLVEVKTTDSLRESQIYTWINILPQVCVDRKVVCVNKESIE